MVDKNLIKQRKEIYGDVFSCIRNEWEHLFQKAMTDEDVAAAMALMKKCRIIAIQDKLSKTASNDKETLKKLNAAMEDTIKDMKNYEWIANNYEEYKLL